MMTHMTESMETIGKRIARLRQEHGWTQQTLADRIAVSRVAISHIEMDLTIPGERTVTLMAGAFKMPPLDLVKGTTYPHTKAERLPLITCCHTDLDMELSLIENDLNWLKRLKEDGVRKTTYQRRLYDIWERWQTPLSRWDSIHLDDEDTHRLTQARQALNDICLG
jgi:transcriptional regulator with XRE-family HTH domain